MPQTHGNDRTNEIDAVEQYGWKSIDTDSYVRLKRDDGGIVIHVKRDSLPMYTFAEDGYCVFLESPNGIVRGSLRKFASRDKMVGHVRDWQASMKPANRHDS